MFNIGDMIMYTGLESGLAMALVLIILVYMYISIVASGLI